MRQSNRCDSDEISSNSSLPTTQQRSTKPSPAELKQSLDLPPTMSEERSQIHQLLKNHPLIGASVPATIIATLSSTPLENLKTRMQMHKFNSIPDAARYIYRSEGLRGYCAGFFAPVVSVTLVRATNFTVQGKLKSKCSDIVESFTGQSAIATYNSPQAMPTVSTVTCSVLSGMASGLASCPIACPFELSKNVVQTSVLMGQTDRTGNKVNAPARHINTIAAFRKIVSRQGIRGLYTGFNYHAARDTIGTGLYFGIYETVKQFMHAYFPSNEMSVSAPIVAGAFCGVIPWMITYPLDTKKTRVQSTLLEISDAARKAALPPRSSPYMGMTVSIMRTMFQNVVLMSFFEYFKRKIEMSN